MIWIDLNLHRCYWKIFRTMQPSLFLLRQILLSELKLRVSLLVEWCDSTFLFFFLFFIAGEVQYWRLLQVPLLCPYTSCWSRFKGFIKIFAFYPKEYNKRNMNRDTRGNHLNRGRCDRRIHLDRGPLVKGHLGSGHIKKWRRRSIKTWNYTTLILFICQLIIV